MKISILKSQVVMIVTDITAKQVKLLSRVNPQALALHDDKGNETFRVATTSTEPSLNDKGLLINEKKAIVVNYDKPVTEEKVREDFSAALLQVAALEAQVAEAFAKFDTAAAAISFEKVD